MTDCASTVDLDAYLEELEERSAPLLTEEILALLRPRPHLRPSEWAEKYRWVTEGPLATGDGAKTRVRWSNASFPLQIAPMDAGDDERWDRIVLVTCPQAFGKTSIVINTHLKAQHYDGCDTMYCNAAESVAKQLWEAKIRPAIEADEELALLIAGNPDEGGRWQQRKLTNGTLMYFAGMQSLAELSGKTLNRMTFDDVQAAPEDLGGHGHPVEYGLSRLGAFASSECAAYVIGTAGEVTDYLWRELVHTAFFTPYVPCLSCGAYQLLAPGRELERMVYDADDSNVAGVGMRCANPDCDHVIRDDELPAMLRQHVWVSTPPELNVVEEPGDRLWLKTLEGEHVYPSTGRNTRRAGFWANAFYWPFKPWVDHVREFIESRGDPSRLKTFQQNVLAIASREAELDLEQLTVEELEARPRERYAFGSAPAAADVVTITVDCQSGYAYYVVRAWRKATGDSWLVDVGYTKRPRLVGLDEHTRRQVEKDALLAGLEDIYAKDAEGWPLVDAEGEIVRRLRAQRVLIDSRHLYTTVATFCRRRGMLRWSPIHGVTSGPIWPPTGAPRHSRKSGRVFWPICTAEAKHCVRKAVRLPAGVEGYWREPDGMPDNTRRAYHKHLSVEQWDAEKHRWAAPRRDRNATKQAHARHDWWDCEAYQIAAALAVGVNLLALAAAQPALENNTVAAEPDADDEAGLLTPDGQPFLITQRE